MPQVLKQRFHGGDHDGAGGHTLKELCLMKEETSWSRFFLKDCSPRGGSTPEKGKIIWKKQKRGAVKD